MVSTEAAILHLNVDFTGCIPPVGCLRYIKSTSITSLRDACGGGPRNDYSSTHFRETHFLSVDTRYSGGERRV
jgi:hypothetical protein